MNMVRVVQLIPENDSNWGGRDITRISGKQHVLIAIKYLQFTVSYASQSYGRNRLYKSESQLGYCQIVGRDVYRWHCNLFCTRIKHVTWCEPRITLTINLLKLLVSKLKFYRAFKIKFYNFLYSSKQETWRDCFKRTLPSIIIIYLVLGFRCCTIYMLQLKRYFEFKVVRL